MLSTHQAVSVSAPCQQVVHKGKVAAPVSVYVASKHSDQRAAMERHIASGFHKVYQANITEFMPLLVGLGGHKPEAALGIRTGREAMFVEHYFDTSLAEALSNNGIDCPRHRLAEIGNLYSASSRYTMPLLLLTAMALFHQHVSVLVFTATDYLQRMMTHGGLTLHPLVAADAARLPQTSAGKTAQNWGSYYQTNPQVVAAKVADIMQLTLDNSLICAGFAPFAGLSPAFSAELGAQL